MQVREAITGLKTKPKQNNQRDNRNFRGLTLDLKNVLVRSAIPKGLEDHGKQLEWMIIKFFPMTLHNIQSCLEHSRGGTAGVSLPKSAIKRCLC